MIQLPFFINCRDRVAPLKALVGWLERIGQEEIILIDNDSTYPPLRSFYHRTPHDIVYLDHNVGHFAPWSAGVIEEVAQGRNFIVSDPDILPIEECPDDAIDHLFTLLMRYPNKSKVGLGLKIDDLPDCYKFKANVIAWETQFWGNRQLEPEVYESPLDTTFAVYRSHAGPAIGDALRTGYPYIARHATWYVDSEHPTKEERYYMDHAAEYSQWGRDQLPPALEL